MHSIDFKLLEWPSGQSTEDLIKVTNKNVKVENFKVEVMISGEKETSLFHQGSGQEISSTSDEPWNRTLKILKYRINYEKN